MWRLAELEAGFRLLALLARVPLSACAHLVVTIVLVTVTRPRTASANEADAPEPTTELPPESTTRISPQSTTELPPLTLQLGTGQLEFFPEQLRYPRYLADPRRPRWGIAFGHVFTGGLPAASSERIHLDAGAHRSLLQWRPSPTSDMAFTFDMQGAMFTQFDRELDLDSIGWDGWFGFHLVFDTGSGLLFKLGQRHLSAHLGDEYAERTGTVRRGYTREDLSLAVAAQITPSVTAYAEYGLAYHMGAPDQASNLVEYGAQFEPDPFFAGGAGSIYAGVHVKQFEENDWQPDVAAQTGLVFRRKNSSFAVRFPAIEVYMGRSILGELNREREGYIAIGAWMDF